MGKTHIWAVFFSFGLLLCAGQAQAHEFIVKPDKVLAGKGDSLHVQAQAAHVFMISEEAEPVATVLVTLLQNNTSTPVALAENTQLKALSGTLKLPESGTAMLVGHRLPQIWSDTTAGVLEGDRKTLEAQGKKVLKVGRYEKFAKTLINPDSKSTQHQQALGHQLEIVLLTNPASVTPGSPISCQVLLNGKPVKAPLGLTYEGYSTEMDTYLTNVTTDADGMATLNITTPGLWMLRTEYIEPITDGTVDKHNMRATYVFPVQ